MLAQVYVERPEYPDAPAIAAHNHALPRRPVSYATSSPFRKTRRSGVSSGWISSKPFTRKQFLVFSVTACCTAGQIGSSFMALPNVSIASVVMVRNLCTAIIAVLEYEPRAQCE